MPQCRITDLCRRRAKQTAVHRLLVKKLKKLAKHFQEFEKGPYEEESPMLGIPIGISFFTNQKMDFGFWMTLLGLESNLGLGFSYTRFSERGGGGIWDLGNLKSSKIFRFFWGFF